MILTMTKYHENLLREGTLSLLAIVKLFSFLETKMILQIPEETFLWITRYLNERISTCSEKEEWADGRTDADHHS